MYQLIEYPTCSTCQNAKKLLIEKGISFETRNIKENNPTAEEITNWIKKYNIDIKKLFNTSGILYKELKLKDKLLLIDEEEKIQILASNGMLVKRPIIFNNEKILIGFKKEEWNQL